MEMKKIHLSTVAVISHSPVSWHERTNNVCYRWHLSCITLCISSSFGKSCFHICWLIFFFFFFWIPCWKIINIYTQVHSSTHLKLHVTKREHTNALWDLRKTHFTEWNDSQASGSRLLASAFYRNVLTLTVHGYHYDIQINSLDQHSFVKWNINQGYLHPMRNNSCLNILSICSFGRRKVCFL